MIYGLAAALGWGVADLLAAVAARRLGSRRAVVVGQLTGLLLLSVLAVTAWPAGLSLGLPLLVLGASGVFGAVGYLAFYRGLELGPLALVSPIGAGYGAVTVVLSLLILREALSAPAAAGVALTLVGVLLTSGNPRAGRRGIPGGRSGVPHALAAAVAFGVGAFVLGLFARRLGWLPSVLLVRLGSVTVLLPVLAATRSSPHPRGRARDVGLALLVGALDVVGLAAFARASEVGHISVAAAVSATYPLVPAAVGVGVFKELIAASQWAGIVLVVGGLVLLGLRA